MSCAMEKIEVKGHWKPFISCKLKETQSMNQNKKEMTMCWVAVIMTCGLVYFPYLGANVK